MVQAVPASSAPPSSNGTPEAKRVRMFSPTKAEEDVKQALTASSPVAPAEEASPEPENDELEADDASVADSAHGSSNLESETTSITSSIYRGYIENGRKYQNLREGEYWGPSDERQYEAMHAFHLVHKILDHQHPNPLFHSPIPDTAQNILDVGTGTGVWAREVADMYPSVMVKGIDLAPVPDDWVPPNCVFECDDVLKSWMTSKQYDLVHLRHMFGSFTPGQWIGVYKQAYENLAPGGWIEHLEPGVVIKSDDGTMPPDSAVARWGKMFTDITAKIGKPLDNIDTMRASIDAAGFINVQEKDYKIPFGGWARGAMYKEVGKFNLVQLKSGMEGYAMYLLTKFGEPTPWSPDEVQVYLAKARADLDNPAYHMYISAKRVWAQKPFDQEVEV